MTPADKAINVITKLKSELASILEPDKNNQIDAITNIRTLFSKHCKTCDAPNKNNAEISADFEAIDHESPKVPIVNDAPSPRVHKFDSTPPSKTYKSQEQKLKRLSSPKEIKKTKSNIINSLSIATRIRS